jgi:hypothetical protein
MQLSVAQHPATAHVFNRGPHVLEWQQPTVLTELYFVLTVNARWQYR